MSSMIILALCMSYAHTMIVALSWTSFAHTYHIWPLSWSLPWWRWQPPQRLCRPPLWWCRPPWWWFRLPWWRWGPQKHCWGVIKDDCCIEMSRGNGNYQGLQRTRRCTTVHSRSLWNKNWCAERKKFVFCETVYKRSFSTTPGPPKIMRNDEKQWRGGGVGQDRSFHHTKLVPISRFGPVVSVRKKEVWKHTLGSAVAFLAISSEPNHIKPVFSKVSLVMWFCAQLRK